MKPLALYALEAILSGGVLLAAYALLLERRVRFGWCRRYLLALPLLSALIPLLRIPVWPAKVVALPPVEALPALQDFTPAAVPAPAASPGLLLAAAYLLGVALLAGVLIAQAVRIHSLRRGATVTHTARYTIVRTRQRIASFSFFRSIYVWESTPQSELQAIVAHEASHIAHRHSAERLMMECLKALLWWNPFVWIAARRLTEAEEFEADSDVLRGGYDLTQYMHTIFRQQLGYSPDIANGLRDSLTKKRFKMMTTKISGRYSLLRLAGTLPALAGLLCAFSFTARASVAEAADPVPADSTRLIKVGMLVFKDGAPLSGAVVRFDNTAKGTVTDTRGEAHFKVPAGTVLEVLYPDCDKHIFQVPDAPHGDVAYALIMGEKEPADKAPSDKPLYLLDGMQIDSPEQLDPAQIASISFVRKEDAARYGEKGRNGVVLLTKKPIPPVTPASAAAPTPQTDAAQPAPQDIDQPFLVAEVMPRFRDGDLTAFRTWVQTQLRYPAKAIAEKIEGRVVASFIVERDGSVSNVRVLQSPDQSLADEAVRVLRSSPAWTPGTQRGKAVRVKYTLPVDFRVMAPKPQAAANDAVTQTGTVTDSEGAPVAGAIIRLQGTPSGTVTAADGSFSLRAPKGAPLEVIFPDYDTQRFTAEGHPLRIVLTRQGANTTEEIVVISYGNR